MVYDLEYFNNCVNYINSRTGGFKPETGIILGSGLSGLSNLIENEIIVNYSDIPGFPVSTAPGHEGRMLFGTLEGRKVVCMSGRFHRYEGYSYNVLGIPARILGLLGIEQLIVTNAAGGINPEYRPGDVMLITDHIKLFGDSPLMGANIDEFGPRFSDSSQLYNKKLTSLAFECAKGTGLTVHQGVYFYFPGPQFETPAEIRAARILGANAAGMSTCPEAIAAAHMGIPVLGFSLITNMAAGVLDKPLSADDVNEAAYEAAPKLELFTRNILKALAEKQ